MSILLVFANELDKQNKFKESDFVLNKLSDKTLRPLKEPENFLENLRESFIDFLTEIVVKDFKQKYNTKDLNGENLIIYYLDNKKKYKEMLDKYNLSIEQTEGILTDKNFVHTLDEKQNINKDDMVRIGE